MKKTITTIIIATMALTFNACKKSEETKTKKELLTTGSWKMTAYTVSPAKDYNGDGTPDTDWFSFYYACEKDNTFTFKTDNSVIIDEGATKCGTTDPQTTTEANGWSLTNNDNTLNFIDAGATTLITLDANILKFSFSDSDSTGTTTYTLTFGH